ncbi:hypothetical protein [Agaribacter flavus]|uniref:Uncharacterized protein n=1 Tax=Agaribacter flavus TaxID=1902781 RepID=A0ABV7FNX3_9ALTE
MSSLIIVLLGVSSASFLFFAIIPESFLLGSISMLVVMLVMCTNEKNKYSYLFYILANIAALSVTVTNWMAGFIATFMRFPKKLAIEILKTTFIIVAILSAIQFKIFPSSEFFLFIGNEAQYVFMEESGTFIDKLRVFFISSFVIPELHALPNPYAEAFPLFSIQTLRSQGVLTLNNLLAFSWLALLVYAAFIYYQSNKTQTNNFLLYLIIGQLCLHAIYGDETFLYSLHWMPFLVIFVANIMLHHKQVWVKFAFLSFIGLQMISNLKQLQIASNIIA